MIAFPKLVAEVPDRVAGLIGAAMPPEVMAAEDAAVDAAITVSRCRSPYTREARERALSDLARANKTLAAWDPRLMVTPKQVAR